MSIRRSVFAVVSTLAVLLAALVTAPAHANGVGYAISGRIASGGLGMAGAGVNVLSYQDGQWLSSQMVYSDANGDYAFSNLVPGTYRVSATQYDPVYRTLFYPNAAEVGAASDVVILDQNVPDINITFPPLATLTGRVLHGANPVDDATVSVYVEDGGQWRIGKTVNTVADGTFSAGLLAGTYLVRAGKKGYTSQWAGGTSIDTATRFTVAGGQTQPVGDVVLTDRVSDWGKVAGQKFPYCTSKKVGEQFSNRQSPQGGVPLPFPISFYGAPYDSAFINHNGTVTFSEPLWGEGGLPVKDITLAAVLPFMSMLNTWAPGSADVTYGSSPDGTTFCVLWDGVGSMMGGDSELNTFQVLIIKRGGEPGRANGDFDIVFNYDAIRWDAGFGPLGPTGASVGYTAGSGLPGTFLQQEGSLTLGAFLDSGPQALIRHSANSTQPGRYVYEIRNGVDAKYGSATGVVTDSTPTPVAGAWVAVCLQDSHYCQYASTGEDGRFAFGSLPVGDFRATVSPPGGSRLNTGYADFTVAADTQTVIPPIVLEGPQPPPGGTTITNIGTTPSGEPIVYWNEDLNLSTLGCAGGTATYRILQGGAVERTGPMTENPAGKYSAVVPKLYPLHGAATIDITITCPGGGTDQRTFDVYIDPSGKVVDQYGPVADATVTLKRSDAEAGPYTVVPDGDAIMSPGNRKNPSMTTADGDFGWDVIPGWYKVSATKAGCNTAETAAMPVPPPQLNLRITLSCEAPKPAVAPTINGTAKVGQTLTLAPGTWPAGIGVVGQQWLRAGVAISGANAATYVATDADAGKDLSVRVTLQRTGYEAFSADTAAVKVEGVAPQPQPQPEPKAQSVSGKVPTKVKVGKTAKLPSKTNAGQKVGWKTLSKKTCKVTKGKVKGVKKGTCKLKATAAGNSDWLALAKTYKLKVK